MNNLLVRHRIYILMSVLFVFQACQADSQQKASLLLPYYSDCDNKIDDYVSRMVSVGYDISYQIQNFHRNYDAHPSIKGTLVLEYNKSDSDIEELVNGLETLCFPTSFQVMENNILGMRLLRNELKANESYGKKSNFITIYDSKIKLYQAN